MPRTSVGPGKLIKQSDLPWSDIAHELIGADHGGLGLSIIDELARAYGGALRLRDSPLGGLRVEVDLPRADA